MYVVQVFTFGWREDIRVGDPLHTKKVCFDAVSHNSPVTLYDCHGMKGNQLWAYRKVLSSSAQRSNITNISHLLYCQLSLLFQVYFEIPACFPSSHAHITTSNQQPML